MTSFCRSGMLVLQDKDGLLYYFDPGSSLHDIAQFIWKNQSLREYRADDSIGSRKSDFLYVEMKEERPHRLRGNAPICEDKYFQEI